VNPGFENEWNNKISNFVDITKIDYLIMNHAEPDHAGSIPFVFNKNENVTLVTTEKGAEMARIYYNVPKDKIKVVKDNDKIELGGKTLKFIEAPWLHWPETMFTYLEEEKILFPCDFLGLHTTFGFYDDEVDDLIPKAKTYFGEIMMPFRNMGKKALEKIKDLDINTIAPSHGPIHRNPDTILNAYRKWTNGETEKKAIVAYVSMWGSTEKMINAMVETLRAEGIDVSLYKISNSNIGDIAKDLVDSKAVVLGVPTVLGNMHPLGIYASYLVKALRPPLKYGVVISSYGWGGGAVKQASELLGPTGIEVVGAVDINGPPKEEDIEKVIEIGMKLAENIKG
jgi:flavorubredoxin